MNSKGLHLQNLTLHLGERLLVGPLNLSIQPGEIVTLMGESGAGKSSVLAHLCGTLPAAFDAAGEIWIDATEVSTVAPQFRRFGILFQDDLLFPHLSVGQNLAFGLAPCIQSAADRRDRIERALGVAGLVGFEDRDPATLSGGQRARVALMRVLLSEPRALLLDEPFSKLDPVTRQRFREFVFDHARQSRLPTLLVSHDRDDAVTAAGAVLNLPGASAAC